MSLADIVIPDTAVGAAAHNLVARFSSESLVNHCLRSYLFAAALAASEGQPVDQELLYVSALLHDLGLVGAFDNAELAFEEASAAVTVAFTSGAGWPSERRRHAGDAIIAHMRGSDRGVNYEGYLLDLATGLDISGRHLDRWPRSLVTEILQAHPRLDITTEFTALIQDQAARKPDSAAGAAVRSGIVGRIANNPLDRLS